MDRLVDTPAAIVSSLGELQLHCQSLLDPGQEQTLLVFTAVPGSESYEKLQLLAVVGEQRLDA